MKLAISKRFFPLTAGSLELLGIALWILFCLALIGLKRYTLPLSPPRAFLVNNLFLGMLPWLFSGLSLNLLPYLKGIFQRIFFLASFSTWLLFLPNSLYLFTDLVHLQTLKEFRFNVLETFSFPYWLDLIIFLNFGLLSFYLGILSLFRWHQILRSCCHLLLKTSLLTLIFALVGVGVYLGRFIRLFSWNALTNPNFILDQTITLLSYPYALIFSASFSLTYAIGYFVLFSHRF